MSVLKTLLVAILAIPVIFLLLGIVAVITAEYTGPFQPYRDVHQIVAINRRTPNPSGCTPKVKAVNWPPSTISNARERFAKKVRELGATAGAAGMLEIDRELVGDSVQIALDDKAIEKAAAEDIRRGAERQLFKPNSRSFVLMHNYEEPLIMDGEPKLLAERNSPGRLVGISMAAGRGFPPHGIGLLIFEDCVCRDDLSFTIKFPKLSMPTSAPPLLAGIFGVGRVADEFVFGGESSILNVIAASYRPHVPAAPAANTTQPSLSPGDLIALGQLAVDIVKLIGAL